MEEVQQGTNGTESQPAVIPTTITTSQFSQIAQQVIHRSLKHSLKVSYKKCHDIAISTVALALPMPVTFFQKIRFSEW